MKNKRKKISNYFFIYWKIEFLKCLKNILKLPTFTVLKTIKLLNMKNAVNWFEIYVSDFNRAMKFYTEVFRFKLTELPMANDNHPEMKYAVFEGDANGEGAGGALVKINQAQPGMGGTLVYFNTEEINEELSRVEAAGGKIIRPKISIGDYGFIALAEDSEGNMIGMHSQK